MTLRWKPDRRYNQPRWKESQTAILTVNSTSFNINLSMGLANCSLRFVFLPLTSGGTTSQRYCLTVLSPRTNVLVFLLCRLFVFSRFCFYMRRLKMKVFGGGKEIALPGESHWSVRMSVQAPCRCPPSPFSMTSFASPSHAPLSRLRPPLSQFSFALRSYHTSPDFIWPSPANQRPTSGWSPWQPTGPNIRGFKRWAGV